MAMPNLGALNLPALPNPAAGATALLNPLAQLGQAIGQFPEQQKRAEAENLALQEQRQRIAQARMQMASSRLGQLMQIGELNPNVFNSPVFDKSLQDTLGGFGLSGSISTDDFKTAMRDMPLRKLLSNPQTATSFFAAPREVRAALLAGQNVDMSSPLVQQLLNTPQTIKVDANKAVGDFVGLIKEIRAGNDLPSDFNSTAPLIAWELQQSGVPADRVQAILGTVKPGLSPKAQADLDKTFAQTKESLATAGLRTAQTTTEGVRQTTLVENAQAHLEEANASLSRAASAAEQADTSRRRLEADLVTGNLGAGKVLNTKIDQATKIVNSFGTSVKGVQTELDKVNKRLQVNMYSPDAVGQQQRQADQNLAGQLSSRLDYLQQKQAQYQEFLDDLTHQSSGMYGLQIPPTQEQQQQAQFRQHLHALKALPNSQLVTSFKQMMADPTGAGKEAARIYFENLPFDKQQLLESILQPPQTKQQSLLIDPNSIFVQTQSPLGM